MKEEIIEVVPTETVIDPLIELELSGEGDHVHPACYNCGRYPCSCSH